MSFRPITDTWILARPKVSYYGAYCSGFLERARNLLGVSINDPILHICSGKIKEYPFRGFGHNDKTLDLDPSLNPDYCQNCESPYPKGFKAILADPPYTEGDAEHYTTGKKNFPSVNKILRNGLDAVESGGKVGILHYILPSPPNEKHCGYITKPVAYVGVLMGYNNRIRVYSVFEKI